VLDKPEKTRQLVAALKAGLPFEVELSPYAPAQIRSQGIDRAVEPRQIVSEVSYAGDEGGSVCHLLPRETDNVIILSLTHVRVDRKNPFWRGGIRRSETPGEEAEEAGRPVNHAVGLVRRRLGRTARRA